MRQRSFYFSEGQYLQLLQSLCHDLTKSEAFVQLMGSAKSGKSALCETLTLYLRRKGHDVVYIDYPIESPEMLRGVLAQKFNLPSTNNVARQLEDTFLTNYEKPKLLIFDDAHQLSDITLLEIHRMAEIQVGSHRVLNVLLCGEQELDARLLNKKELASLLLNVSRKYLLKPMDKETLSQFFFSYVAKTDSVGLQLAQDALDLLYRSSKGYPGPATLLVELMVQSNPGNTGQKVIAKLELAELIKDSDIQQGLPSAELFNVSQLKVLGPIAAVFTIAAMGFMFSMINGDDNNVTANGASVASVDDDSPFSSSAISSSSSSSSSSLVAQIETVDDVTGLDSSSGIVALLPERTTEQTGDEETSNPTLEPTQNTQLVNREPILVQPIPSLLRPASIFSLDDEEDEEPVSDSGLALVTAAEIGLAAEEIAEPEFEDFENVASIAADTIDTSESNVEIRDQKPLELIRQQVEPNFSPEMPVLADADMPENLVLVTDEALIETEAVGRLEEQAEEQSEVPLEGELEGQAEQLAQETVPASDTAQINVIAEAVEIVVPESTDTVDTETQNISVVEAQPTELVSTEVSVRARVDSWVLAWEQQRLEGYFSSYSSEFEPRYDSSLTRWQASRTRVIGNAEWIRLTLNEYEIIEESASSIEVHFWLDYESPTYSDSTKKKLVLGNDSGDWMILEEINLEVRS